MKKTLDYIFGIITGIAITIAVFSQVNNLNAYSTNALEVVVVNPDWNPVKVSIND